MTVTEELAKVPGNNKVPVNQYLSERGTKGVPTVHASYMLTDVHV